MLPAILLAIAAVWLGSAALVSALLSPGSLGAWLGNTLWLISGGWAALYYYLIGAVACLTIVGIPVGRELFKFGRLSLVPFGLEVYSCREPVVSFQTLLNIMWLFCFGWQMMVAHAISAFFASLTIVGIPFARQHVKLMVICFWPFGHGVRRQKPRRA